MKIWFKEFTVINKRINSRMEIFQHWGVVRYLFFVKAWYLILSLGKFKILHNGIFQILCVYVGGGILTKLDMLFLNMFGSINTSWTSALCFVFKQTQYYRGDAAVAVDSAISHMAWYSTLLTSENILNLTNPVRNM